MKLKTFITAAAIAGNTMTFSSLWAQQEPDSELLKAKEFLGTAGIPGDKWIEGETMVPHIAPAKHFKSAMLYYPGTEELQPDEVRVIIHGFDLLSEPVAVGDEHFRGAWQRG